MKKKSTYGGRWELWFTDQQADWDVWEYWELERVESMAETLWEGARLFDVGSEHGSMSAILATIVGPQNMVLIESSPEFWPEIYLTWGANGFATPHACWAGLVGDRVVNPEDVNFVAEVVDGWPACARTGGETENIWAYRYIRDHLWSTPMTTIDLLSESFGAPDAITMDIEGGEYLALLGAERVLREEKPLLWVSIHPDLLQSHHGVTDEQVHSFLTSVGYEGTHLATDHEEHWFFRSAT